MTTEPEFRANTMSRSVSLARPSEPRSFRHLRVVAMISAWRGAIGLFHRSKVPDLEEGYRDCDPHRLSKAKRHPISNSRSLFLLHIPHSTPAFQILLARSSLRHRMLLRVERHIGRGISALPGQTSRRLFLDTTLGSLLRSRFHSHSCQPQTSHACYFAVICLCCRWCVT